MELFNEGSWYACTALSLLNDAHMADVSAVFDSCSARVMGNSSSSSTGVAVGVSVVMGLLLLSGIGSFLYMRRKRAYTGVVELESRKSIILERSHPAALVTPFGVDAPAFGMSSFSVKLRARH